MGKFVQDKVKVMKTKGCGVAQWSGCLLSDSKVPGLNPEFGDLANGFEKSNCK